MTCDDCRSALVFERGALWHCPACGYTAVVAAHQQVIGFMVTREHNRRVALAADRVPLGYFDPAVMSTFTMGETLIAIGDERLSLIIERARDASPRSNLDNLPIARVEPVEFLVP